MRPSALKDFDNDHDGHPHMYLYDCDAAGANCTLIAQNDVHVRKWDTSIASWIHRVFTVGSVNRTIAAGRTLRVRLLFGHRDLWWRFTAGYPTALVVTTG